MITFLNINICDTCKDCTLNVVFLESTLPVLFQSRCFRRAGRFSCNQSLSRVIQYIFFMKTVIRPFSTFRNPFQNFLMSLLAERQLTTIKRSWRTESELMSRQNISLSSITEGITQLWDGRKSMVQIICDQLGYTTTCPPTMIMKDCKLQKFDH